MSASKGKTHYRHMVLRLSVEDDQTLRTARFIADAERELRGHEPMQANNEEWLIRHLISIGTAALVIFAAIGQLVNVYGSAAGKDVRFEPMEVDANQGGQEGTVQNEN